jgi:multiple sugar transport system ATP-binding protein
MDEPLSNLDAKLRVQMRAELKRFHQELNATVVYVTHDQLEAVTMADRIAVMHLGLLQQYGSPDEIFNRPRNTFVAGFVGSPAMNLLRGQASVVDDQIGITGEDGWTFALEGEPGRRALSSSGQVLLGVRHGHVRLSMTPEPAWMEGRIYTVEPTGDLTFVHVQLGNHLLVASTSPEFRAQPDAPIWLTFDQDHLHLFDAETELRLEREAPAAKIAVEREAATV